MTAHHIRYELDSDGIATLTIDRPEKRGAMTYAMLMEFTAKVAAIADDERVRVLIVTGSGGSFCAGTDLADLATVPGETRGVRGSRRARNGQVQSLELSMDDALQSGDVVFVRESLF